VSAAAAALTAAEVETIAGVVRVELHAGGEFIVELEAVRCAGERQNVQLELERFEALALLATLRAVLGT